MQLMASTAADYGEFDLLDPASNIEVGCRHLEVLWEIFEGEVDLVLAAYNAGEGAVQRAGGIPPFPETRHFGERVKRFWLAPKGS